MLKKYSAFLDVLNKALFFVIAVLAAAMTLIILYQVVLRYCFNAANIWAEELAKFLFVWVTVLGSSIAIRKNVHLKVDLFLSLLKPRARLILQIVSYLLILGFLIYLCRLGISLMGNTMVNRSAGLRVPMAIPYSAVPVGAFLMSLTCLEFILKRAQELRQLAQGPDNGGGEQ
ncbi:2,3-diketo-L-gulonate TRAP transporter small permease YiaM [Deltaproteobacteria bacterium]|nr:2,3-diketo-L-gulonate TRAP transporter small permease YiaM [Deltaproteobacteria bacterium]